MPVSENSKRKVPNLSGINSPKLLAAYAEALRYLRREYVTGVGIGYAVKNGRRLKALALSIHVAQKRPAEELTEAQRFPKKLLNVRVDVVEVNIRPQHAAVQANLRQFTKMDPLQPGFVIKTETGEIGTIGLLVKDAESGQNYILGAGHVLAKNANGVFQPNHSIAPQPVGRVKAVVSAPIDAAVASYGGRSGRNQPFGTNTQINSVRNPKKGEVLTVSGAFSGVANATVDWIGKKSIDYGNGNWRDIDGFQLSAPPSSPPLTLDGDSGALWFDTTGAAVGLHVGGETKGGKSWAFACNVQDAMTRLSVKLA